MPKSEYSPLPMLNISLAPTEAHGSQRRVLGLVTTLDNISKPGLLWSPTGVLPDTTQCYPMLQGPTGLYSCHQSLLMNSNCVYRPCGDVHEARGVTPSKKTTYKAVSGSTTPAATVPVQRAPQQLSQALEATLAAHRSVYNSCSNVARHAEQVQARWHVPDSLRQCSFSSNCASTVRTSVVNTSHWIGFRSFQQHSQALQSHERQERLGSTQTAALVTFSKHRCPQKWCHTCTHSGDSLRPSGQLRVSPEEFLTTVA